MKKWNKEEDNLLKKNYPNLTMDELLEIFKGRSPDSIEHRARRLRLKKSQFFYNKGQGGKMAKENPLKGYVGKDRIVGRPIRLNKKTLKIKKGKNYSEVVFFGDVHYGARECDIERAQAMLKYCYEHNIYVFLMGDLIESATRYSVGSGVYRQNLNPQQQMEFIEGMLRPLAEKKLILGMLDGNHELRIEKETGVLITKILAKMLNVSYLGSACWNLWKVGKQNYTVYTLHGSSGSRFVYTKLKALVDISHSFDADLMAMGHVHELADTLQLVQKVDMKNKKVIERKKHLLLTGSYLKYDKSYVQERGYPMAELGSPKVKFWADEKRLHISY